jgi:hypothetical protein
MDLQGPAAPAEYLSGDDDVFDPATGWDFAAISSTSMESLDARLDPDDEPDETISDDDTSPPPPRRTATTILEVVKEQLDAGALDDAVRNLEEARQLAPEDPLVSTWFDYAERRLMAKHCPGASLDSVPSLTHPAAKLLQVTRDEQQRLIGLIDGRTSLAKVRARTGDIDTLALWRALGKLTSRGWVRLAAPD